jgi:hypothetical protein
LEKNDGKAELRALLRWTFFNSLLFAESGKKTVADLDKSGGFQPTKQRHSVSPDVPLCPGFRSSPDFRCIAQHAGPFMDLKASLFLTSVSSIHFLREFGHISVGSAIFTRQNEARTPWRGPLI